MQYLNFSPVAKLNDIIEKVTKSTTLQSAQCIQSKLSSQALVTEIRFSQWIRITDIVQGSEGAELYMELAGVAKGTVSVQVEEGV